MNKAAVVNRCVITAFAILATASAASAQSGVYLSGATFADIRAFGSYDSNGTLFRTTDNSATGIGGSLRVGTWLHPRFTIELGIDAASTTSVDTTGEIIIQIFPPPPKSEFDLQSSTKYTSVAVVLGYHPPPVKRVRLGYLAGFAFVHERNLADYLDSPTASIGSDFSSSISFTGSSIGDILGRPTAIRFTKAQRDTRQNSGALVLGFEAAVDVSTHLAIVPELRATTFSSVSGPGVFLIRPGIGVRWSF
jgi:hypothetical protein